MNELYTDLLGATVELSRDGFVTPGVVRAVWLQSLNVHFLVEHLATHILYEIHADEGQLKIIQGSGR